MSGIGGKDGSQGIAKRAGGGQVADPFHFSSPVV